MLAFFLVQSKHDMVNNEVKQKLPVIILHCLHILQLFFSVYFVLLRLKASMSQGEFFMAIRNMPVAYSLYIQVRHVNISDIKLSCLSYFMWC